MKSTPAALVAHFADSLATPAFLVRPLRKDGVVYGFTDHDVDITYGGLTYRSELAVNASSIEITASLGVDNLEVAGFLMALGISEADIAAGLWDFGEVQVLRVNYADLTMGDEKIKRGFIGEISVGRGTFTNEVRGLTQKLQQTIGESYSPSCKANLFDARCKVVPTEGVWKFSNVPVGIVSVPGRIFASGALTQATDFFTGGRVVWTAGNNTGLEKEIKSFTTGGVVILQEPMPNAILTTDVYTIYAGCQKRWQIDCVGKFSNGKNHRGFPFLPGEDQTLKGY